MTRIRLTAFLAVILAALSSPGHAANVGAAECVAKAADLASGSVYTNVCRSLIHVGKCTSTRADKDAWSCDYVMYSPGDSFSVAGDQKVKILACRPEFGNCVQAVRCLPTRAPATEKSVIAAAKKCGIDF
jgi:hypothetical protein